MSSRPSSLHVVSCSPFRDPLLSKDHPWQDSSFGESAILDLGCWAWGSGSSKVQPWQHVSNLHMHGNHPDPDSAGLGGAWDSAFLTSSQELWALRFRFNSSGVWPSHQHFKKPPQMMIMSFSCWEPLLWGLRTLSVQSRTRSQVFSVSRSKPGTFWVRIFSPLDILSYLDSAFLPSPTLLPIQDLPLSQTLITAWTQKPQRFTC